MSSAASGGASLRHRGLARAGNAGKQKRAAVANGARSMHQETALAGQQQRVHDAQHGIERVGIDASARMRPRAVAGFHSARKSPRSISQRPASQLTRTSSSAGFGARRGQLNFKIEAGGTDELT